MYLLQKKRYNIKKTTYQIVYFLFWYVVIKLKALIQFYKIISRHSQIPIYTFLFFFSFNLHIFSLLRESYIWDFFSIIARFSQENRGSPFYSSLRGAKRRGNPVYACFFTELLRLSSRNDRRIDKLHAMTAK